jgi:hypothetical protein
MARSADDSPPRSRLAPGRDRARSSSGTHRDRATQRRILDAAHGLAQPLDEPPPICRPPASIPARSLCDVAQSAFAVTDHSPCKISSGSSAASLSASAKRADGMRSCVRHRPKHREKPHRVRCVTAAPSCSTLVGGGGRVGNRRWCDPPYSVVEARDALDMILELFRVERERWPQARRCHREREDRRQRNRELAHRTRSTRPPVMGVRELRRRSAGESGGRGESPRREVAPSGRRAEPRERCSRCALALSYVPWSRDEPPEVEVVGYGRRWSLSSANSQSCRKTSGARLSRLPRKAWRDTPSCRGTPGRRLEAS